MYINGKYTKISKAALPIAKKLTNGSYQSNLLDYGEAWSGMTLQGKAKKYGGRYKESRENFLYRLRTEPALSVVRHVADHNRIEVYIVTADEAARHGGPRETIAAYAEMAETLRRDRARVAMAERIAGALADETVAQDEAQLIADAFA